MSQLARRGATAFGAAGVATPAFGPPVTEGAQFQAD